MLDRYRKINWIAILARPSQKMIVLGIETSCDETGVALYNTTPWEEGKPAFHGFYEAFQLA